MSDFQRSVDAKKATALLILDRQKIDAVDLKEKILEKAFPPSDWETVEKWLEQKGLASAMSDHWYWDQMMEYGGIAYNEYGLGWHERTWVRRLCHLLGFTYKDWEEAYRPPDRQVSIQIPDGWFLILTGRSP